MSMFFNQERMDEINAMLAGTIGPTASKALRGEDMFVGEAADYPRGFDGMVGQREAIDQLRVAITSAKARKVRLDHTLFDCGEPGIGKTTLAYETAYELGAGIVTTTGKGLTGEEFADLAMGCQDGDCIFVDELHLAVEGNRNRADWLLTWMLGNGLKVGHRVADLPDVTLLGATTDAGKLPLTVLDRFMNTPPLGPYSRADGPALVANLARRIGVDLDEQHYDAVAQAGDLNPRRIRKVLCKVRDLAHVYPETHPNLEQAFAHAQVTADGLTTAASHMLLVLATKKNHAASIKTISDELGAGPLGHHERVLTRRGYIEIDGLGRRLTDRGLARVAAGLKEGA